MTTPGADYSSARPDLAEFYRLGFRFAGRYFGPGTGMKMASKSEVDSIRAHGIALVTLVEGAAGDILTGAATGRDHAQKALAHAHACGMPPGRPFYFAADKDLTEATWRQCWPYLDAAAAVVGRENVGLYGEYDVMRWAARDGKAAWFFQTYAWSNKQWFPGNAIEQFHNGVMVAGGDVDLCRGMRDDYGQWGVDMPLTDDDIKRIVAAVTPAVTAAVVAQLPAAVWAAPFDSDIPGPADDGGAAPASDWLKGGYDLIERMEKGDLPLPGAGLPAHTHDGGVTGPAVPTDPAA